MELDSFLCFQLPPFSKKYYLIVFFLIGSFFRVSIPGLLSDYVFGLNYNQTNKNQTGDKDDKLYKYEKQGKYYYIICNILSDILTGFVHLYFMKKLQLNDNNNNNNNNTNIINDDVKNDIKEISHLEVYERENDASKKKKTII